MCQESLFSPSVLLPSWPQCSSLYFAQIIQVSSDWAHCFCSYPLKSVLYTCPQQSVKAYVRPCHSFTQQSPLAPFTATQSKFKVIIACASPSSLTSCPTTIPLLFPFLLYQHPWSVRSASAAVTSVLLHLLHVSSSTHLPPFIFMPPSQVQAQVSFSVTATLLIKHYKPSSLTFLILLPCSLFLPGTSHHMPSHSISLVNCLS